MSYKPERGRSSPYLWRFPSELSQGTQQSGSNVRLTTKKRNGEQMNSSSDPRDREEEIRRAMILRDYHDQPFADRNYGAIRGLFESPMRKIIRHEGIAFIGEFVGTFSFLYMAFMVVQIVSLSREDVRGRHTSDEGGFLLLAFAFGMALAVNVAIWYRVSGGQFNPAVSLGLMIMGAIKPARFLVVVVAQLLGAVLASVVVQALTAGELIVVTHLPTTGPKVTAAQGFFVEMIGTAQLMLTIFFVAVEKHRATPLAPIFIGFSLLLIILMAARFTGASVNPARTLGPAIVAGSFKDIWIYMLAPFTGSLLATSIYALIKWAGYQDVNAGQDAIVANEADYVIPDKEQSIGMKC